MLPRDVLYDLYVNKKMSSLEIADKFGMKHSGTVRKWMKKYNIPRRTISGAGTKKSKLPFSGDIAVKSYFLGLRAGDFHVKRIHKIIRIQTTTTHPAQIELMKRSFGQFSQVCVYEFFNKGFDVKQWFVYCDVDESFSFLLEKPEEIPNWIIEDDELFFQFLAGYADSEGCWRIVRSHANSIRYAFQLSTQDKRILEQTVQKLKQLGYAVNFYLDKKAGIQSNGVRCNKDILRIVIYQTEHIMNIAQKMLLLSRHPEKIEKIKLMLESRGSCWFDIEHRVIGIRCDIKNSRIQKWSVYQSKSNDQRCD